MAPDGVDEEIQGIGRIVQEGLNVEAPGVGADEGVGLDDTEDSKGDNSGQDQPYERFLQFV